MIFYAAIFAISLVLLFLLFTFTNPLTAGFLGILLAMILIFGATFALVTAFFELVFWARENVFASNSDKIILNMQRHKRQIKITTVSAILSMTPIFVISLNSLGQFSLRDALLIVAIETVAIFYFLRRN